MAIIQNGSVIVPASYNQKYSTSSAISSTANAISSGSSKMGFGMFGMAFKVGYSGIMSTFSPWLSYRAAKNEKRLMNMQADLAMMQSKAFHTAADDVMRMGERQNAAVGYGAGQAKSSTRVQMASAGIQVGAKGSSAETLADIDIIKEIQMNQITANAIADSWGYRKQGVMEANKAEAYRSAAGSISPWAAAITTMMTDAMNMLNSFDSVGGGGKGSDTRSGSSNGMASFNDYADFFKSFKGLGK